jgi:putative hydrolase of the HAD superfamily
VVPRALVFDYDGVIVDSETLRATVLVEILAELGVKTDFAAIAHLFGSTSPDIDLAWDQLLRAWLGDALDIAALDVQIEERVGDRLAVLPLLPGVRRLLDEARELGWATAVASGKPKDELQTSLARLGIDDCFDTLVSAAEVASGKPAPDVFLEAARRLAVEPQECVVVEDSIHGCQGGLAAGMVVICCPCAVTRTCDFPSGIHKVASLADVSLAKLCERSGNRGST